MGIATTMSISLAMAIRIAMAAIFAIFVLIINELISRVVLVAELQPMPITKHGGTDGGQYAMCGRRGMDQGVGGSSCRA